ncbi:MAG: hypothetical protein LBL72_04710 [Candidatus Accumulibacter sp.]|jgi:hypothetical protein|nr:hypothetical protein [Accumulibacter sp.]
MVKKAAPEAKPEPGTVPAQDSVSPEVAAAAPSEPNESPEPAGEYPFPTGERPQ